MISSILYFNFQIMNLSISNSSNDLKQMLNLDIFNAIQLCNWQRGFGGYRKFQASNYRSMWLDTISLPAKHRLFCLGHWRGQLQVILGDPKAYLQNLAKHSRGKSGAYQLLQSQGLLVVNLLRATRLKCCSELFTKQLKVSKVLLQCEKGFF